MAGNTWGWEGEAWSRFSFEASRAKQPCPYPSSRTLRPASPQHVAPGSSRTRILHASDSPFLTFSTSSGVSGGAPRLTLNTVLPGLPAGVRLVVPGLCTTMARLSVPWCTPPAVSLQAVLSGTQTRPCFHPRGSGTWPGLTSTSLAFRKRFTGCVSPQWADLSEAGGKRCRSCGV